MAVLLTGVAGFIGFHVAQCLLERGEKIVGIDNVNAYYETALKESRLSLLTKFPGFTFCKVDIADRSAMEDVAARHPEITSIIHLAAQAGVRYSLTNPYSYAHSNLDGQLVILEIARALPRCDHLVYASSSSVYGGNTKLPFSVEDRVDQPLSLYAATKKAGELMVHSYSHLFRIPSTGLRFFTVYGPWGRPDMAPFLFTRAIAEGKPIDVFNNGDMRRDFTYIDDIVQGIVAAHDAPPVEQEGKPPYRLYNIGNHRAEDLMRFIGLIEKELDRKAIINFKPMQPGDVKETYADIDAIRRDLAYEPTTSIDEGVPRFISWYKDYYQLN